MAVDNSQTAKFVYKSAIVWDNHGCLPFKNMADWLPSLSRYRKAGVTVASINVSDAEQTLEKCIGAIALLRRWISDHSDKYILATHVSDIEVAKRSGKLAIFFDVEGAHIIGEDINIIPLLYDLGVRWMLIAYNKNNLLGGGCHDDDTGLTALGYRAIAEMDRVGMLKDCSHIGYRTARNILSASQTPAIFSHSNPRAMKDHPRNIPDDLILSCANIGGVICLNGVGIFLGDNDASVSRLADHIDYVADLVGARHIGLGLDYIFDLEGLDKDLLEFQHLWPPEFDYKPGIKFMPPESLAQLTEELLRRNYKETDIAGILGKNMMRVARTVWK